MPEVDLLKKWLPMINDLDLSREERLELAGELERAHNDIGAGEPPPNVQDILPGVIGRYMARKSERENAGRRNLAAALRGSFEARWNLREEAAKTLESGAVRSVEDAVEVLLTVAATIAPDPARAAPAAEPTEFACSVEESAGGGVVVKWWTTIDASDVTERELTDREYALLQRYFDDRRAAAGKKQEGAS